VGRRGAVDKFFKISCQATICEGLEALENAQVKYLSRESEQRILLVVDKKGKIKGKLSPIDLMSTMSIDLSWCPFRIRVV